MKTSKAKKQVLTKEVKKIRKIADKSFFAKMHQRAAFGSRG